MSQPAMRCFLPARSVISRQLLSAVALLLLSSAALPVFAAEPAEMPKINYDEHVRPILRQHCFACHNQNEARSGLALDSFGRAMEGGSGGQVVLPGDLESSRLWALVSHTEEPAMPPMQDKLPQEQLDVLRQWIEGGLLENASSKVKKQDKPSLELATTTGSRPEGPPALPEGLWRQPVTYTERPAAASAVAASPWAPLAAVAGQQQIVLYHTDSGECLGVLPFPEGVPYTLTFSRNGELLLAGGGHHASYGCAVLYDVKSGRRLLKVGDELDVVLAADIDNTHSRIALAGPQRIVRIFSTETGEQLHEIQKHTDWVYAVRFSPDGVLLATADRSNGLFIWEADTAREYLNLQGHTGPIRDLSWRPDSNVLASASEDGSVRLWEMVDGKQLKNWNAHRDGTLSVTYTHDGRLATAGRDKTVKLWDGNGKMLKAMPAFEEPALQVAMTHDGQRVLGGDWSGQIRLWAAADAKPVATLATNPPTLEMLVERAAAEAAEAQAAAQQAADELAQAQAVADEKRLAAEEAAAAEELKEQDQAAGQQEQESLEADKAVQASQAAFEAAQQRAAAAQDKATHLAEELARFQHASAALAAAADQARSQVQNAESALQEIQQQQSQAKQRHEELLAAQRQAEQEVEALRKALGEAQSALDEAEGLATAAAAQQESFEQAYGSANTD